MNLTYRDINFNSDEDCATLALWFNQDVPALSLAAKGGETIESVRENYLRCSGKNGFQAFFICVDEKPVGFATFFVNPPHKLSKELIVWPSLAIGNHQFRRQGLVGKLGEEICRRAKQQGATHIEAGIFDSNRPMSNLLIKYGFTEIGHQVVGPAKIESTHYLRPITH